MEPTKESAKMPIWVFPVLAWILALKTRFVIVVRSWDRLHGRAGCGYHDDAGCVASRKIVVGRRVGVDQLVSSGVT